MKLFSIVCANRPDELAEQLRDALRNTGFFLHKDDSVEIKLSGTAGLRAVEVHGILPKFRLSDDVDALCAESAGELAEIMMRHEEEALLRCIIRRDYQYEQEEDIGRIMEYCRAMLDGTAGGGDADRALEARSRRKSILSGEIASYLKEQTVLNWEGFVRFRLRTLMEELRDVAEFAVDEFVMDRQYQEFITLLKYFVYIQEAKVPFVHLIHKGGSEFMLLDERMEPIDTDNAESTVTVEMLEKDMNFEDMIVSTLITVSPGQIYIHTREPELQVIKTIGQIFENRVELCEYCRLCHNLDRTHAAEYNKR